jgi:hypothetical protein
MERATRETWAKRVEQWCASGLTATEFAGKLGVRARTLKWWKWRIGSTTRRELARVKKTAISPLTFVEMTSSASREPIAIELVSGTRVVVASDFDTSALTRVLDVLERRR